MDSGVIDRRPCGVPPPSPYTRIDPTPLNLSHACFSHPRTLLAPTHGSSGCLLFLFVPWLCLYRANFCLTMWSVSPCPYPGSHLGRNVTFQRDSFNSVRCSHAQRVKSTENMALHHEPLTPTPPHPLLRPTRTPPPYPAPHAPPPPTPPHTHPTPPLTPPHTHPPPTPPHTHPTPPPYPAPHAPTPYPAPHAPHPTPLPGQNKFQPFLQGLFS